MNNCHAYNYVKVCTNISAGMYTMLIIPENEYLQHPTLTDIIAVNDSEITILFTIKIDVSNCYPHVNTVKTIYFVRLQCPNPHVIM